MGFHGVNLWAVVVAAISAFVLEGALVRTIFVWRNMEEGEWVWGE